MSRNDKEIKKEIAEEKEKPKKQFSKGSSSAPTRVYNTRSKMKTKKITGVIEISSDSDSDRKAESDTEADKKFFAQYARHITMGGPDPGPYRGSLAWANPNHSPRPEESHSEPASEVDSE